MISLLIIIPLYWLAVMAIVDALHKPAKKAIESVEPKEITASLDIVEPPKPIATLELPAPMPIPSLPAPVIIKVESVSIDNIPAYRQPLRHVAPPKEILKPLQPSIFIPLDFELKQATGNVISIRGVTCK